MTQLINFFLQDVFHGSERVAEELPMLFQQNFEAEVFGPRRSKATWWQTVFHQTTAEEVNNSVMLQPLLDHYDSVVYVDIDMTLLMFLAGHKRVIRRRGLNGDGTFVSSTMMSFEDVALSYPNYAQLSANTRSNTIRVMYNALVVRDCINHLVAPPRGIPKVSSGRHATLQSGDPSSV
jgi:hypothetical protein